MSTQKGAELALPRGSTSSFIEMSYNFNEKVTLLGCIVLAGERRMSERAREIVYEAGVITGGNIAVVLLTLVLLLG